MTKKANVPWKSDITYCSIDICIYLPHSEPFAYIVGLLPPLLQDYLFLFQSEGLSSDVPITIYKLSLTISGFVSAVQSHSMNWWALDSYMSPWETR